MANETIMLAKPYTPKKLSFPVVASEKLDGVAADFYKYNGETFCRSRQDEPIKSVQHCIDFLHPLLRDGDHVICELYSGELPFKEISGLVRRQCGTPQVDLVAFIYDYYNLHEDNGDYLTRMRQMGKQIGVHTSDTTPVRIIPATQLKSQDELDAYINKFSEENPTAEGLVIRMLHGEHSEYKFGRSWGMQKKKVTETVDLPIVGMEEAISKDGEPLGMLGRMIVRYKGQDIGAGPGKLDHAARKDVWENMDEYIGKIAEVSYMPDASYDALREARVIRIRLDKSTPNEEDED